MKAWKEAITQPDQTTVDALVGVYFKAGEGMFRVYLPEHFVPVIKSGSHGVGHCSNDGKEAYVYGKTLEEVVERWRCAHEAYRTILQTTGAVKVIRFQFRQQGANLRYGHPLNFHNSHGPGKGLLIDWKTFYRSGDRLYHGHYDGDRLVLQDHGRAEPASWESFQVIEWTEEREAFFKAMDTGLLNLIDRMIDFVSTVGDDPDAAINVLVGAKHTLLAAP